jgi:hypothetical protein
LDQTAKPQYDLQFIFSFETMKNPEEAVEKKKEQLLTGLVSASPLEGPKLAQNLTDDVSTAIRH